MASKHEKFIDEIGNMSVLELSELVKELEEKFGVSAAMPVAAAAAAPAAGQAEAAAEKSEYKVTLESFGDQKIKVIKALRSVVSGLSLSEAKEKVEGAPTVIAEAAPKEEAEKMKKDLEEAGAKVTLA